MFNNITSSIGKIIKHIIIWIAVFATAYSLYKTITLEDSSIIHGCKILEINKYTYKSDEIMYIFDGKLQIDKMTSVDSEYYNSKFIKDKNTLYYVVSYSNEFIYMIIFTILLVIFTIYLLILTNYE